MTFFTFTPPETELSSLTMVEMAVFNTASLTGTFQALNGSTSYLIFTGNGFQFDIKILKMYNASNVGITLSFDGTTRNDFIPSGGTLIVDLQTNAANSSSDATKRLNGRAGQILYGSGSAGVGNLYISGYR